MAIIFSSTMGTVSTAVIVGFYLWPVLESDQESELALTAYK